MPESSLPDPSDSDGADPGSYSSAADRQATKLLRLLGRQGAEIKDARSETNALRAKAMERSKEHSLPKGKLVSLLFTHLLI